MPWLFYSALFALAAYIAFRLDRILGPLFFYDLMKTARGSHIIVVRTVFAMVLGLLFLACVANRTITPDANFGWRYGQMTEAVFWTLAAIEYALLLLLTPAYLAGALTEVRGTLEILFTTDLRSREIVLGLFASRLAKIAMVLTAGFPIFSALQFLGGLDPGLVIVSFLALACTLFGLGGLTMFNSVRSRSTTQAAMRTYLMALGFLLSTWFAELVLSSRPGLAAWPSTATWKSPVTANHLVAWASTGNLITSTLKLFHGGAASGRIDLVAIASLRSYAVFHILLGLICCTWCVRTLRGRALETASIDLERRMRRGRGPWYGLLREWPLLWKELIANGAGGTSRIRNAMAACGLALMFLPAMHVCWFFGRVVSHGEGDLFSDLVGLWTRSISTMIGALLLSQVAYRASSSISRERERQTLDCLLITPLPIGAIIFSKWLGSLAGSSRTWAMLLLAWSFAVATGVLHPLGIAAFLIQWMLVATCLASVGIYFSAGDIREGLATLSTAFVGCLFLAAGALAVWIFARLEVISSADAPALFPPAGLFAYLFSPEQLRAWANREISINFWTFALLVLWPLVAVGFFKSAYKNFSLLTGRRATQSPELGIQVFVSNRSSEEPREPWIDFCKRWLPAPHHIVRDSARAFLFLLPLVFVCSAYGWLGTQDQLNLQKALCALDESDPHWRLAELEAARITVPQEENGALQVMNVFKDLPSVDMEHFSPLISISDTTHYRLTWGEREELKQFCAHAEQVIPKAIGLKNWYTGRFPTEEPFDPGKDNYVMDALMARRVGLLLNLEGIRVSEMKEVNSALECCLSALSAADCLGDTPNWAALRTRQRIQSDTYHIIIRCLGRGIPNVSLLKALQDRIAEEDRVSYTVMGARSSRALAHERLKLIENGVVEIESTERSNIGLPSIPTKRVLRLMVTRSLTGQHTNVLLMLSDRSVAAGLSITGRIQAFIQLQQFFDQSTWLEQESTGQQFLAEFDVWSAERRCMVVALALERYRQAKSAWPNSLQELVPIYLPLAPLDPFTESPLRYVVRKEGVAVYSVGPDGKDDGGVIDHASDRAIQPGGSSGWDIGFGVLNLYYRPIPLERVVELSRK